MHLIITLILIIVLTVKLLIAIGGTEHGILWLAAIWTIFWYCLPAAIIGAIAGFAYSRLER